MTSQQFLVCDSSTVANFKSWASALSNFIRSAGWTNSSDTGQLNGAGAGNWAGVTTVPGSGAFYYEVFQPGDGLQNYYLKLEYGNIGSTNVNAPTLRITLGASTNGSGTLTGFTTSAFILASNNFTAGLIAQTDTVQQFECDFSGDSGRLCIMLWRNHPWMLTQMFCIQRSLNASGSPTNTYVTLFGMGNQTFKGGTVVNYTASTFQQSLHFTYGAATLYAAGSSNIGWNYKPLPSANFGSLSFAGMVPIQAIQPVVGVFDYPCTAVACGSFSDFIEGAPITVTNQYGQTKTYMPTKGAVAWTAVSSGGNTVTAPVTVLMEYD